MEFVAYYRQVGDVPPKRHTQFRDEHGALRYEELMGEEGFSSDSSLLYHRGVPSAIVDSQVWELQDLHPPRPTTRSSRGTSSCTRCSISSTDAGSSAGVDAVTGHRLVLGNGDVRISYVVAGAASPLYRNAVGDECVFVEAGAGTVETVFGVLTYRAGDYVVIPRATTHRWVPGEECGSTRSRPTATSPRPSATSRSSVAARARAVL